MSKELKHLRKAVESQGWTVEQTKSNHWKFRGPDGQMVMVGNTISDWRGLKNVKSHLRQAGCKV
jgi:predicted RNA binding protein YcfA (HicA-like mRNA interferase family)